VSRILERESLVRYRFAEKHADIRRVLDFPRLHPRNWIERKLLHGYRHRDVRESYKFCFVRNPFGWYESNFKFMRDLGWPSFARDGAWHPTECLRALRADSFDAFIANVLRERPGFLSCMYSGFVSEADFVGKTENLPGDLEKALRRSGVSTSALSFNLDPVNTSSDADIVWDEDLRDEIYRTEYASFKRFEYSD